MDQPSQDILSLQDAVIDVYLARHRKGELTYVQALEGMVIHLAGERKTLFEEVTKLTAMMPPAYRGG